MEDKQLLLLPEVGETLYIPDVACSEHCMILVYGGRATVSQVACAPGPEGPVPLVQLEGLLEQWFCYDVLQKYQWDLRMKYGETEARLEPNSCFAGIRAEGLDAVSYRCLWADDPRSRPPRPDPPSIPHEPWEY